eukprot:15677747-Heterocapsa_arctica.AAC.1
MLERSRVRLSRSAPYSQPENTASWTPGSSRSAFIVAVHQIKDRAGFSIDQKMPFADNVTMLGATFGPIPIT